MSVFGPRWLTGEGAPIVNHDSDTAARRGFVACFANARLHRTTDPVGLLASPSRLQPLPTSYFSSSSLHFPSRPSSTSGHSSYTT